MITPVPAELAVLPGDLVPAHCQAVRLQMLVEQNARLRVETMCQVVTWAALEPHPFALLASENSEAVVFDLA